MPPNISLTELYTIKRKKDLCNNKTFDIILDKCHIKIKKIANAGGMKLFYEIPFIILGYPLYNIDICIEYIIKCLKKSGLFVYRLTNVNNIIYISWDPSEIDPKYKLKLIE